MRKSKEQIQKISAHVQFETVSPATKLLEERRKMYEVHEAFEVQKEEFKKYCFCNLGTRKILRRRNKTSEREICKSKSTSSISANICNRMIRSARRQRKGSSRTSKSTIRKKIKYNVIQP
jgi:hypothetical protein